MFLSNMVAIVCAQVLIFFICLTPQFPSNTQQWKDVAAQFYNLWDFPNCGGATDGKHVRIVPPPNSGSYYFNYKGFCSIVLLAVVSAKYEFLYVDVGMNGRHSDGGVMMHTEFYDRLQKGTLHLPNEQDNIEGLNFVFVADEAFSLGEHILKPFPMRNLTPNKESSIIASPVPEGSWRMHLAFFQVGLGSF